MELNYFNDVMKKMSIYDYLNNINKKILFIYSPTSMEKIKLDNKQMVMENWHNISKNIIQIDKYIERLEGIEEIITLGGGSTIDIGKYISYQLNIKYTCIPSMLSTNSYATNKVALIKDGKKVTLEAKMPDKIIIDDDILKLSKEENLYGLADVLSIYTALYDWNIANKDIGESKDKEIYYKAENLLREVLEFIENNSLDEIIQNNIKLFEFIGIAGYITNLYGTGRPESGSEHIMAKEIERRIEIPHGISVSLGIIIMTIMQKRNLDRILQCMKKIKVIDKMQEYGISKEFITSCLEDLKPREDRYTIVNRYYKDKLYKDKVLQEFEKRIILSKKCNLGIIGLGYVGAPLAYLSAMYGYNVIGIDSNQEAVDRINKRKNLPVELKFQPKEIKKEQLYATSDYSLLNNRDIIIICVPTPTKNNIPDLSIIKNVVNEMGKFIKKDCLLIVESTLAPGMTKKYIQECLYKNNKLVVNCDYDLAYCPERIDPGNKKFWVGNINRVCGGSSKRALNKACEFYSSIIDAKIIQMNSIEEAELVKIWENSMRNVNIAQANLLAKICDTYNLSLDKLQEGLNSKIEQFELSLAYPGIGPGGHCIPEDIHYLINISRKKVDMSLLKEAVKINESMPKYAYDKLISIIDKNGDIIDSMNLLMLGLSYKPNSDDTRRSQAIALYNLIKEQHKNINIYDPIAKDSGIDCLSKTEYEKILEKAEIIIISCAHDIFLNIDYTKLTNVKYILDCWNKLDEKKIMDTGINYIGVGK